jgi:hypothetical protein
MGHADAGYLAQPLAQQHRHVIDAAAALGTVHQTNVNAGVDFACCVAGIDGGEGVTNFRKRTDHRIHLLRPGPGDVK